MKFLVLVAAAFLSLQPASLVAQSLDQQAWNKVWDRLEKKIQGPKEGHIVHVLQFPVPMSWGERHYSRRTPTTSQDRRSCPRRSLFD